MSNTITVKLTSSKAKKNALLDAIDTIFRAYNIMDISPILRFTKVDGVATPTFDKVLIDGITLVTLRKAITFDIDTKLSAQDTFFIEGFALGRLDTATLTLSKR